MQYAASVRLAAALGVVAATAIAIGGAGAAPGASATTTYLMVSASGEFRYDMDYGDDPRSQRNGKYSKYITWSTYAIVVYDGRSFTLGKKSMVVDGLVRVEDQRTRRISDTEREPLVCDAEGATGPPGDRTWEANTETARFAAGRIKVSKTELTLDPGRVITTNIGCAASESLPFHGLPGGPTFNVPTVAGRSRFTGTRPFTIICNDEYSHAYKPAGKPNGHSFSGTVHISVKLAPFPKSELSDMKTALRDKAGENLTHSFRGPEQKCT